MELEVDGVSTSERRIVPLGLRSLRLALTLVNKFSPSLASLWVYRIWFSTRHHPVPKRELDWVEQARQYQLDSEFGSLAVYSWGEGPVVLLVHGWSGRAVQLGAFAQPLANAGFKVVAFDAPAHGKNPGKQTNIFRIITAMNTVIADVGPVHGIICHSFGAMVTARALATGVMADKVVCISPPAHMDFLIESVSQTLKIPVATKVAFINRLEKKFGNDFRELISAEFNARVLSIPVLIIHDKNDKEVPWQQGERLASAWTNSRLELTEGLGHRRILRNQAVVDMVVDFIR